MATELINTHKIQKLATSWFNPRKKRWKTDFLPFTYCNFGSLPELEEFYQKIFPECIITHAPAKVTMVSFSTVRYFYKEVDMTQADPFPKGAPLLALDEQGNEFTGTYIGLNNEQLLILEDTLTGTRKAFPRDQVDWKDIPQTVGVEAPRTMVSEQHVPAALPPVPSGASTYTPTQIAQLLGLDPKQVRKRLRSKYGAQHKSWDLPLAQYTEIFPALKDKLTNK